MSNVWQPVDCSSPGSSQEYWSGLPFPPPGDLPNAVIERMSLASPVLAGRFFYHCATWEAPDTVVILAYSFVLQHYCKIRYNQVLCWPSRMQRWITIILALTNFPWRCGEEHMIYRCYDRGVKTPATIEEKGGTNSTEVWVNRAFKNKRFFLDWWGMSLSAQTPGTNICHRLDGFNNKHCNWALIVYKVFWIYTFI